MELKEALLVAFLLLVALAVRLEGIDRPLYGDEADWLKSAKIVVEGDMHWTNTFVSDNPPLGKATFTVFYWAGFGNLRWTALLFGLGTLLLAYFMVRDYLGKQTALIALALLALSIYHIIASQQVDRDGSMIAFLALLTLYSYFKYADMKLRSWLAISLAAFTAAVLMRTTMVALILPLFAYDYARGGRLDTIRSEISLRFGKSLGGWIWKEERAKLAIFALAFIMSFAIWAWLDSLLGLSTLTQNTLTHYLAVGAGSSFDLKTRMLKFAVAAARLIARTTVPLAIALVISIYSIKRSWLHISERERPFLFASLIWISFGVLNGALATQGDPPRYFSVVFPSIAIVTAYVASKARVEGSWTGWAMLSAAMTIAYLAFLSFIDFNEVNLLLLPYAALVALALMGIYWLIDKDLRRLVALLLVMSAATSLFMLTDFRTYDAMRSLSVEDAAAYFNAVGAQNIAESQERTLDLYVTGKVRQYEDVRCIERGRVGCPKDKQLLPIPAGYYVVDFPLKPNNLDPAVGAQFRFNLFDKSGVQHCMLVRSYVLHSILVSEFYRCDTSPIYIQGGDL